MGDRLHSGGASDAPPNPYYRLAPAVDTVRLDDGNVLFRSDSLAVRLEGPAARLLAERVLPLLDGQRSLADLARQLPDVPIEELHRCLDGLVDAQVVRRAWHPIDRPSDAAPALGPFLALLDAIGVASGEALEALGRLRIAIFGLEGHGAHLATILVRCGIGGLMLVDPYPCEPGNLVLLPPLPASAIGTPRADALKTALHGCEGATEIATSGPDPLTRERIAGLARGCHALAGCFDRGFSSANHWINRASLEQGIPAIYGELRGHTALIGPLVLPGQTACYMCYRMRAVACESDFAAAMSYEEFLDQHRQPVLHQRAVLPALPSYVGSLMAIELLKRLLSLSQPSLAGTVLELDALSLQTGHHAVLEKPDCPVCRGRQARETIRSG